MKLPLAILFTYLVASTIGLITIALLSSCAPPEFVVVIPPNQKYEEIKKGLEEKTTDNDPNSLAGYYSFPDGGFLEIIELSNGAHVFYGTQRLLTKNFDGELALHPNLPTALIYLNDGTMTGNYNANYKATTHDLEVDNTTTDITGSRLTYFKLQRNEHNNLTVELIIYSSTGLAIEAHRFLESI